MFFWTNSNLHLIAYFEEKDKLVLKIFDALNCFCDIFIWKYKTA